MSNTKFKINLLVNNIYLVFLDPLEFNVSLNPL